MALTCEEAFSGSQPWLGNEASRRMTSSVTLCNEYGIAFTEKAAIKDSILPPFFKGGQGGLYNHSIIPLNPPLEKGDFKAALGRNGRKVPD